MTSAILGLAFAALAGEDCNRNGVDDVLDLRPGTIRFSDPVPRTLRIPSTHQFALFEDLDGDGTPEMVLGDAGGITVAVSVESGDLVSVERQPVGSEPRAMISADLDGDGDPDIATANGLANGHPGNVSVLRNDGGMLDVARNYAGVRFPASLGAGDLDGDSDVDLVTVGGRLDGVAGGLAVLRNDGGGRFDLDDTYPAGNEQPAGDPAVADIDGDGALDVVITKPNPSASIQIFHGDGRGRLGQPRGLALPPGITPAVTIALDADRDGDLDFASPSWFVGGEGAGAVYRLQNVGGGVFEPADRIADTPGAREAVAADLDADGWTDLALSHAFVPAASVLRGGPGGIFAPLRRHVLPGIAEQVEVVDWDRDGAPDLLSLDLLGGVAFLLPAAVLAGPAASPARHPIGDPFGPLFADLDGDADLDLAIAGEEPETLRLFRNEGGALEALEPMPSGEMDAVLSADLDGDGHADIAGSSERGLELFFGDGRWGFEPRLVPSPSGLGSPFLEDMDGDGDIDIFASSWTPEGFFALVRNGGARTFEAPVHMVPMETNGSDFHAMPSTPGDFDGDGDTDVLIARTTGPPVHGSELILLVNAGNGTLEMRPVMTLDRLPVAAPIAHDLDGDGRLDVMLGAGPCPGCDVAKVGMVIALHGSSDGLREVERHEIPVIPGGFEVRDMDGDRDMDLVTLDLGLGESFHLLRNDGSGRFAPETIPGVRTLAGSLIAEDMDGDGHVDVAIAGRGPRPTSCRCEIFQVDVFRNRGNGSFEEPSSFGTISPAWRAEAAPLGPGLPHLLLVDDEGLTILQNLTEPAASRDRDGNGIPDECQTLFRRGDPSGDGASDLSDAMVVLRHLFLGDPEPGCLDAADANDDGRLDITDPIAVLEWLFLGGPPPPAPGPPGGPCGPDPPGSTLGCEAAPGCRTRA